MRPGTSASAHCKAWLWAVLVVASTTAALARTLHDAPGGGQSAVEIRDAWVGARRGRVPLQTKLATPSYFKGSGRVTVLNPIDTTTAAADISSKFKSCFEDFEIEYTAGSSRVVNISKLRFRSTRTVPYLEQWSGVNEDGDQFTVRSMELISCQDGYQVVGKYDKLLLSDLQLPSIGRWQCQAGLPRPFNTTPVKWTGTQPQCTSFDGFRCSKPALCSTLLPDIKKREMVMPLACGAHHLSVWGLDGYNRPNTWCSVARKIMAPSPAKLPFAGAWKCLDGLPDLFKNTPIRWMGFQPQCDSLDGKICNKPATREACEARVKELKAAVTPLTCGPYHQSVRGVDGYEKSDSWCSIARKRLAPKEAEVFPVRATWDLKSHNGGKYAEVTLWLVRARTTSGLQGFFASLTKPPTTVPSKGVLPFPVTSGSVLGYAAPVPPSHYSGRGRIQATASFGTPEQFESCLDDLRFGYRADGYGGLTVPGISTVSNQSIRRMDTCPEWNDAENKTISVNRPFTVPCSDVDVVYENDYKPKISKYNSSIEVLPLRVRWIYTLCTSPAPVCEQRVLWLVRETGSGQLQAFTTDDNQGQYGLGFHTEPVNPPAVIPRQSLRSMKIIHGSIFGFTP